MKKDMKWPGKGEVLFKSGQDWHNNASLVKWVSLSCYGENYKDAADALIEQAINRSAYVDAVVYPAVFMYRHYLELTLKDIIFRARRLESVGNGFPVTHKLDILWAEAKKLLKDHYGKEAPIELDYLDSCFAEIVKVDPDSMAFRYPFDKKGNIHLPNLDRIDVRHLRETMGRVANFLSSIATDIEMRLEAMLEAASY